jgi:sec-independent protein translocase protein TatB
MHFGDYTFILLLALVLFGPKKMPEMGRQLGKLLAEFRRASNEFKFQIQEELRNMEEEERKKKLADSLALAEASQKAMIEAGASSHADAGPTILPPSTGEPVSTAKPFAVAVEASPEPSEPGSVAPGSPEFIPPELRSGTNGSAGAATAGSSDDSGQKLPAAEPTAESLSHG